MAEYDAPIDLVIWSAAELTAGEIAGNIELFSMIDDLGIDLRRC
jgi:hypothetical protein